MPVNEEYWILLQSAVSYSSTKFVDHGECSPTKKIMSLKKINVVADKVEPSDKVVHEFLNNEACLVNDLDSNENIDLNENIVGVELLVKVLV